MQQIPFIKKTGAIILASLLSISSAVAQSAPPAQQAVSTSYNQLEILLVSVMCILVFVIALLGRVLLVLGKNVVEKNKNSKILPVVLSTCLLLASMASPAQDTAKAATIKTFSNYGGLSATTFYILVSVLITEVLIIFFLAFSIKGFIAELLPGKKKAAAKAHKFKAWWNRFNEKFTRSVPVEKEADILLDHDYDGIRELDNALPPWWKYGFYLTIGIAIVYLFYYNVFGYGKNPTQEYNAEMARAKIQQEAFEANNKDKIDENNVPMADAAGLAEAKEIFTTKCFACHGKLGEGGAGPNLTDNYWLHKGSINDIFQSIKHGYPDKGMQSWANVYTPKQISYLASYIKTLHGTNPPNAKAPQGDLYMDSSDTTSAKK